MMFGSLKMNEAHTISLENMHCRASCPACYIYAAKSQFKIPQLYLWPYQLFHSISQAKNTKSTLFLTFGTKWI